MCYVVGAYVLDGTAAVCGLQDAVWPYVSPCVWSIRVLSLVCAVWLARRVYRAALQWRRARLPLAIALTALWLVAGPLLAFYVLFLPTDTRWQLVSPGMVNWRVAEPMRLPPTACSVRMSYTGWNNPSVLLRFTADPPDAEEYVQRVSAYVMARPEGEAHAAGDEPHPQLPVPSPGYPFSREMPWWYLGAPNEYVFLQKAPDEETIVLYRSVE